MNEPQPTQIVLAGWHGHDNAGDDATLRAFIDEVLPNSGCQLTVLSELPERVIEVFGSSQVTAAQHYETLGLHGITHLLKGRLWRHLGLLKRTQLFVLGGGSLLRDNTTWHNLVRVVDEIFWTRAFGGKVALYAVGVGPIRTRLGRWLIQQSVLRADLITVRDQRSRDQLLALGVTPARVHVVADPGFLLRQEPVDDPDLLRQIREPGVVGFFPSLGFIEDGDDLTQIPRIAAALDELHEMRALRFLSVPMRVLPDEIDDLHVTRLIQQQMRHPEALTICERQFSAEQIKWLTGEFQLNVTIRLHALIFALSNAVPSVAIEYEPKVSSLLHDFDLGELGVPMGDELTRTLVQRVCKATDEREHFVRHLEARLPAVRNSSKRCFELIDSLVQ